MLHVAAGLAHVLQRPEVRALLFSALGSGGLLLVADADFGKAKEESGLAADWRLPRPLLTSRLVEGLDRGTVLLAAGAGFGKTVALEEALTARGGAAAWVRCAPSQGDPGILLELVVEELRRAAPGVADALGERLATGIDPVDVALAGRRLAVELERLLADSLTLVFDDAEVLTGARGAVDLVDELLAVESPALRVAVASRRGLPLRTSGPRAAGRLTEFGAADLALSPEESGEILSRLGSERDADDVWSATEGWPIAVVLSALAPAGRGTPGTDQESLRMFVDGLLEPLPPGLLADLVDSSLPVDLDPALLRSLGLPAALRTEAARLGLPLQWLDTDAGRWSYHPLAREVLRGRLSRDRSERRRRELHRCCAEALEEAGRGPEAVEHWLDAAAPAQAAAAVARSGPGFARTAPNTVAGWLERLPEEARAAPELRLLEGRIAAGTGRLDEAIPSLEAAVEGFSAAGVEEAAWLARVAVADTHAILEDFEKAIPLAEGYESATVPAAPMAAVAAAASLAGATRYREASELFAKATEHPLGAPLAPFVRGFHGFWVDLQCGRLDAALAALQEAVTHLERNDPFDRLPYVVGMQAVVLEERGEDARALATMDRSRRAAEEAALGGYIGDVAHRFAAGVHARAGRLVEAERELEGATGPGLGWYPGDVELTRATIAAGRGAQSEAVELAKQAVAVGALHPWRARWRNTARLVPVLVAAGRATRARELVDEAVELRPPLASCARLLALRAWLRSLDGDEAGSLDDLTQSWEEAGPEAEHLVRRERSRLEPLLWSAVERGTLPADAVVRALAAAAPNGEALVEFTDHPVPDARRGAVKALAACGHPLAARRLAKLEAGDGADAAAARALRGRLSREPPPLVFNVLGGFRLRRGEYVLREDDWAGRRPAAQRLVRFLLSRRGSVVSEDELFAALWPDRDPAGARRSLQVTASGARAALDIPGLDGSVLAVVDRTYRLELSARDVVDADDFEHSARLALDSDGLGRLAPLEAAAARWEGEPLPEDRYEDWATGWRERLIDLQRQVLGALTDARSDAGDLAGGVEAARQWVELDPRDEAAHCRLMVCYARAGRRGHALRQYLLCRRSLLDELGIEPGAETADLQRRILAGERP